MEVSSKPCLKDQQLSLKRNYFFNASSSFFSTSKLTLIENWFHLEIEGLIRSNIVTERQPYLIFGHQKGTRHLFAADTFLALHKTTTDKIQYNRIELLFATTPTNHCIN